MSKHFTFQLTKSDVPSSLHSGYFLKPVAVYSHYLQVFLVRVNSAFKLWNPNFIKHILDTEMYSPWSDTHKHEHFINNILNMMFVRQQYKWSFSWLSGTLVLCHYSSSTTWILQAALSQFTVCVISDIYLNFIGTIGN